MPFGDRTGPRGIGPRTGRGFGYCSGSGVPGYMNNVGGRGAGFGWGGGWGPGFGGGFGRGAGWGRGYGAAYAPPPYNPDPKTRASALRAQADELEAALDNIKRELENIDKNNTNKQ